MHGRDQQQAGDGHEVGVGVAVREHHDAHPPEDGLLHLGAHLVEGLAQPLPGRGVAGGGKEPVDGEGPPARHQPVLVDVEQGGQLVIGEHGPRQHDLVAGLRPGSQQVALGADRRRQRGDELLPDGIERRVGDLGEELAEIVVKETRPARQHGQGRVVAHRGQRFGPRAHHRLEDEADLLLRIAELALEADQARVLRREGAAQRKVGQVYTPRGQPLFVRVLGCQAVFDLVIVDDAPGRGVDQEHAARLDPPPEHHLRRRQVEDPDLGRHDHEVVIGHPVAQRPEPVAIELGAHDGAVGEGDGRGAVPGLHQAGVELVEGPAGGGQVVLVLPGLGHHHQHSVRQRPAAQVQQLQHLVEAHRVAAARRDYREHAGQVAGEEVARQHGLPGPHPVAVALDGVELPVVGDITVGVGQWPAREGVGREPGVGQGQARLEQRVGQVVVKLPELGGRQHPLVNQRPGRQGRKVEAGDLVLGPVAGQVGPPVQGHPALPGRPATTTWRNTGMTSRAAEPGRPASTGTGRHARTDKPSSAASSSKRAQAASASPARGQEGDAGGIGPRRRQLYVEAGAQETVRHLYKKAGAVAGSRVGALSPRCSSWHRLARPISTMAWLGRPCRWATKATPQASCSNSGRYRPGWVPEAFSIFDCAFQLSSNSWGADRDTIGPPGT